MNQHTHDPLAGRVDFPVEGMTCASCVNRIERLLRKVEGVDTVAVNLATERATIVYQTDQVDLATLGGAVTAAGYDARLDLAVAGTAAHGRTGAQASPTRPAALDAGQVARATVAHLRGMGIEPVMLTGDQETTARAIADQAGIGHALADVRPDEKQVQVRRLQEAQGPVAMVGDGINDAPALAAADVGVALGTGTDVAIESASVTLVGDDLLGLVGAVDVSRATMRNIRQNLFWAFAYNVTLIPLAAAVLYPFTGMLLDPKLAALAMALSSVTVVSNALRLRGWRPPTEPADPGRLGTTTGQPALSPR